MTRKTELRHKEQNENITSEYKRRLYLSAEFLRHELNVGSFLWKSKKLEKLRTILWTLEYMHTEHTTDWNGLQLVNKLPLLNVERMVSESKSAGSGSDVGDTIVDKSVKYTRLN